jgi:hypothetical protein
MPVVSPPRPPVAVPPRPPIAVAPGRRPAPVERDDSCTAAWTLVAVMLVFKVVTIALVVAIAYPADSLFAMLVIMNWPWLIPLALLLSAIPFGYSFRLVRARAKRRALQRAEWNI